MTKFLVTGAAGMLGSKFCNFLYENKYNVIALDNLSFGYKENLNNDIKFYNCDFCNLSELKSVFQAEKPDVVYHMGAYCSEGLSPFIRSFIYTNNIVGSGNVITASIENNVRHIVYTSSMARYGKSSRPPFDEENTPADPMDPYGISKYVPEIDLNIAHQQHGIDYTIIVPHNVISESVNLTDKYRGVLAIWSRQMLEGKDLTIFGDGKQKRAFTNTNDILEPLLQAYTNKNAHHETINLGGIKEISIENACFLFKEVTGCKNNIVYLEPRFEAKEAWCTWKKSVDLLGFEHKTDLDITIKNLTDWAKNIYGKLPQKTFDYPIELQKGLYEYWR